MFRAGGLLLVALILLTSPHLWSIRTGLTFPSADGILITADYYTISPYREHRPLIVLFHQAGWSRGEYLETAPLLNEMGFHCLAVDLRSGLEVNGVVNETAALARKAGKRTGYADAWVDIEAAVTFAREELKPEKLILWGSSYSASLVLRYAGMKDSQVHAVVAFSPGEYFSREGKEKEWVRLGVKDLRVPVFISSAGDEQHLWKGIYDAIPGNAKVYYLPKSTAQHGSRALWKQVPESAEYWKALRRFLGRMVRK